ncbi:hypothetical protein MC885_009702 [Smutsia gigantea]|nr:hypothetical protein MC885_009702 [Smutsia gigantea]
MLETYNNLVSVAGQQVTKPDLILKLEVEELCPAEVKIPIWNFPEEAYQIDEQTEGQHQDDQDKCLLMQVGFPDKKTIITKSGHDCNEFGNTFHLSTNLIVSIQTPNKHESFGNSMEVREQTPPSGSKRDEESFAPEHFQYLRVCPLGAPYLSSCQKALYNTKLDEFTKSPKEVGLRKEGKPPNLCGEPPYPFYQWAHGRSGHLGIMTL